MTARPVAEIDRAASAYIRGFIRSSGLGTYAVAEMVGIHINTFRHYVRGERAMNLADFLAIIDALGLDSAETIAKIRRIAADGQATE